MDIQVQTIEVYIYVYIMFSYYLTKKAIVELGFLEFIYTPHFSETYILIDFCWPSRVILNMSRCKLLLPGIAELRCFLPISFP